MKLPLPTSGSEGTASADHDSQCGSDARDQLRVLVDHSQSMAGFASNKAMTTRAGNRAAAGLYIAAGHARFFSSGNDLKPHFELFQALPSGNKERRSGVYVSPAARWSLRKQDRCKYSRDRHRWTTSGRACSSRRCVPAEQ
jgi:hypothetical protein